MGGERQVITKWSSRQLDAIMNYDKCNFNLCLIVPSGIQAQLHEATTTAHFVMLTTRIPRDVTSIENYIDRFIATTLLWITISEWT